MRVWIDQDLCTGDGLCVDDCPEVFMILEDGISYVHDAEGPRNDPGGAGGLVQVQTRWETGVVHAAEDCPWECIFIEMT
jgi:ferredoxin